MRREDTSNNSAAKNSRASKSSSYATNMDTKTNQTLPKQLQQQQRQPQAGQETQHKTIPANKFAPTLLSSQRRLFATLGMTSYNEIL